MKQKIDFLKSTPQPALQLPAKWITIFTLALLMLLMLISLRVSIRQVTHNQEIKSIHAENLAVTTRFQKAAKNYPILASDTSLPIQIGILEKELTEKHQQYAKLSQAHLRYGFSNYLLSLARIAPAGVWLTHIAIDQDKKNASLSGFAMESVDVSLLLQAIQNTPAFSGTFFNVLYLQDMPEKPYSSFSITNKPGKIDEEHRVPKSRNQ